MKKLLLLILPLYLFCASEDDTCYTTYTIPSPSKDLIDIDMLHVCIDGYSYTMLLLNRYSGITQMFINVDDKVVPATCSCELMKSMSKIK